MNTGGQRHTKAPKGTQSHAGHRGSRGTLAQPGPGRAQHLRKLGCASMTRASSATRRNTSPNQAALPRSVCSVTTGPDRGTKAHGVPKAAALSRAWLIGQAGQDDVDNRDNSGNRTCNSCTILHLQKTVAWRAAPLHQDQELSCCESAAGWQCMLLPCFHGKPAPRGLLLHWHRDRSRGVAVAVLHKEGHPETAAAKTSPRRGAHISASRSTDKHGGEAAPRRRTSVAVPLCVSPAGYSTAFRAAVVPAVVPAACGGGVVIRSSRGGRRLCRPHLQESVRSTAGT